MEKEMIVWYVIAGAVLIAVLFQLIEYLFFNGRKKRHPDLPSAIGFMKEKEMFFIPGDNNYEDGYDTFDDL